MTDVAERLYTDQDDIARLESIAAQLPDEAVVELHLTDGDVITGTVVMRPIVQVFRDAAGNEGINAMVRLDDHARPDGPHYLWLDRIASVVKLGSS